MMGSGLGLGIPGLGMILFWGVLIFLVIWLVRSFSSEKSARKILEERFARGELDQEEFEQKLKLLKD